jgi:hypothetical protein
VDPPAGGYSDLRVETSSEILQSPDDVASVQQQPELNWETMSDVTSLTHIIADTTISISVCKQYINVLGNQRLPGKTGWQPRKTSDAGETDNYWERLVKKVYGISSAIHSLRERIPQKATST